ncbi:nucleoside-diphosphate-sugar epimerase [Pseudovirgaria hyperparasitica]|uniref:Nucleoside-diphosphate-sugar epimerase n=1 Tax=Pseudovirgaria hyperparasitica TaxID=470096 RepID=A0A6A6WHL4_9PEZI|nr:nucleoside-diphosphate-sugar epimerase [Pseudovirgaria hyperparasitica]KAF2760641.1 nucleoside-diphosphate-sugar epimerase [Pseudovirgaria hyperparasitica]
MRILITGAAGFIGQILAEQLLADPLHTLILTDIIEPPIPRSAKHPQNAKCIKADLFDASSSVVTADLDAVYVFHGIMSSGSEANFDLGMRVNVDATRALIDTLRHTCPGVRVIYASSGAVYGHPLPAVLTESVLPTPESSYGVEKMMGEFLINEYTRRGFINGFSLRFPTISVRPGKPTAAASSFLSGMVREPLAGKECVIPIKDRSWKHWLCSPRTLVWNLVHMLGVPGDALPRHFRSVNVPGFQVSVQDMIDALERVGGKEAVALLREEEEPETKRILMSWADNYDNTLAIKLGMKQDSNFEQNIRDYIEDVREA